jgi:SAM-dependent methyltransferase
MAGLATFFGAATPWVAMAAGALVAGLVVVAFRQGRAITIWPPSIGARTVGPDEAANEPAPGRDGAAARMASVPARASARGGRRARGDMAAWEPVSGSQQREPDREYTVDRARDFYQEIAPSYDLRNSGNLVSTHLATVATIQRLRAQRSSLRVLDLGGGTGKLIAIHFFNDPTVSWTYVDSCPAMAAEFRRNLAGYPLGDNAEIMVEDLARALRHMPPASYDVVLLSLVLSSMPAGLDLAPVARVMRPGGSLVITDINPGYTQENPLYKVAVAGEVVALRTTPVDPFDIIRRAGAAGLRMVDLKTLGNGATYYSFMTVFTPAATSGAPWWRRGRAGTGQRDAHSGGAVAASPV